MSELTIGDTHYQFRSPVTGTYLALQSQSVNYYVNATGTMFIGCGETPDKAKKEWDSIVHAAFQDLYGLRLFQMTQEQREKWRVLADLIDVETYIRTAPVVKREIGKISETRPYPSKVEWMNHTFERVSLDLMPSEFAGYKAGQWFEAVVARDSMTYQLVRVLQVTRIPAPLPKSVAEIKEWWQTLPTASEVNHASIAWSDI